MTTAGLSQIPHHPGAPFNARRVIEATVHLPKRGTRWVATYRDATGQQRWKSTGQTDRQAALLIAQELERAARQRRTVEVDPLHPGTRGRSEGQFTQKEIAILMGLSERAVREIEKRALRKLKQHPAVRALWRELIGEAATPRLDLDLTDAEVAAVYGLARTWAERRTLEKLVTLIAS